MEKLYYPQINETLYTETLPNGLMVRVMPKPDFNRSFAVFATDYGGADRRVSLGGEWIDTPAGIAHYLEHKMFDMPDGDNALNLLAMNGASPKSAGLWKKQESSRKTSISALLPVPKPLTVWITINY